MISEAILPNSAFRSRNLDEGIVKMNEKETGSFYTPPELIDYMVAYIRNRIAPKTILEPSAGDGRFVHALEVFGAQISLVEFKEDKAKQLTDCYGDKCKVYCGDFIRYSLKTKNTYDLIIGNPPYIAKKKVPEDQCLSTEEILSHFKLDKSVFQNLWVSFVLSALKLLSPNGAVFFVLPFEFLQVQYAEKLRTFLETKFNTIEIITFEDRVFEGIEQDVCLVYLTNEPQAKPYIQYTTFSSVSAQKPISQSIIMRNKPLRKWSNCILNDEETESLLKLAKEFPKISEFGDISPGIVTGANSFFILPQIEAAKLRLPEEHILPIITKSSTIPSLLSLTLSDFEKTYSKSHRTHLLNLNGLAQEAFSAELTSYIAQGESKKINEGYKCKKRKRWYDVPIIKKGDACFFKRYHVLPRVVINKAQLHTTDIIYNIRFKEGYDAASFAFCFYNSLTLALCEYSGRFYGGGVGELVPSEFKQLNIPYKKVEGKHILQLDEMFRNQTELSKIIDYVDSIVLTGLSADDIKTLQEIRSRYLKRRLKQQSV